MYPYLEEDDAVRVLDDGARVRGEEVLDFLVLERLELGSALAARDYRKVAGTPVRTVIWKGTSFALQSSIYCACAYVSFSTVMLEL